MCHRRGSDAPFTRISDVGRLLISKNNVRPFGGRDTRPALTWPLEVLECFIIREKEYTHDVSALWVSANVAATINGKTTVASAYT